MNYNRVVGRRGHGECEVSRCLLSSPRVGPHRPNSRSACWVWAPPYCNNTGRQEGRETWAHRVGLRAERPVRPGGSPGPQRPLQTRGVAGGKRKGQVSWGGRRDFGTAQRDCCPPKASAMQRRLRPPPVGASGRPKSWRQLRAIPFIVPARPGPGDASRGTTALLSVVR